MDIVIVRHLVSTFIVFIDTTWWMRLFIMNIVIVRHLVSTFMVFIDKMTETT